jgi:multiple sugar transport system ATP-binding protein
MVREPSVFLFDEPLSNLDARLRAEMRDEIASLHRRLGTTMVFVTHDQVEAMSLGQRIAILDEGVLQQVGSPLDVYRRPASLFVARFVGSPTMNTAQGFLGNDGTGAAFVGWGLTLPCSVSEIAPAHGDRAHGVVLGVRPEDLQIGAPGAEDGHLEAEVQRVEALGSEILAHVPGPGEIPWIVRAPADVRVRVGDRVSLRIRVEHAHLFDAGTGLRLGRLGRRAAP